MELAILVVHDCNKKLILGLWFVKIYKIFILYYNKNMFTDGVGGKRRRIAIDEVKLREALDKGWKRETHITGVGRGGIKGEVVYTSPCGRPFKHYSDLVKVPYIFVYVFFYFGSFNFN